MSVHVQTEMNVSVDMCDIVLFPDIDLPYEDDENEDQVVDFTKVNQFCRYRLRAVTYGMKTAAGAFGMHSTVIFWSAEHKCYFYHDNARLKKVCKSSISSCVFCT